VATRFHSLGEFFVGFNFQKPSGGKTSAKFRLKAGLRTLENLKIAVLSL
jgi:hypothetical protein